MAGKLQALQKKYWGTSKRKFDDSEKSKMASKTSSRIQKIFVVVALLVYVVALVIAYMNTFEVPGKYNYFKVFSLEIIRFLNAWLYFLHA